MLFLKKNHRKVVEDRIAACKDFRLINPLGEEPKRNAKCIVMHCCHGEVLETICIYDSDNGHGRFVSDGGKRLSDCIAWKYFVEGGEK